MKMFSLKKESSQILKDFCDIIKFNDLDKIKFYYNFCDFEENKDKKNLCAFRSYINIGCKFFKFNCREKFHV